MNRIEKMTEEQERQMIEFREEWRKIGLATILEAELKAIDSLARYKFAMFGYWAGIWVHLNRISGEKRANPFKPLVETARVLRGQQPKPEEVEE